MTLNEENEAILAMIALILNKSGNISHFTTHEHPGHTSIRIFKADYDQNKIIPERDTYSGPGYQPTTDTTLPYPPGQEPIEMRNADLQQVAGASFQLNTQQPITEE